MGHWAAPAPLEKTSVFRKAAAVAQLFNFQWLARPAAGSLFLPFPYSSRRRLFINGCSVNSQRRALPETVDAWRSNGRWPTTVSRCSAS